MAQKITTYLLITLILSLGIGQILRFDVAGIPVYLHDIIVASILFIHIRSLCNTDSDDLKKVAPSVRLILVGIVIGWGRALTLYPIAELGVPFLYTIRVLAYLTLYYLLKKLGYHLSKSYFYLAGILTLSIGLAQYSVMPDMRWAQYLGWDDHLNRITMPHYDPTFTGVMLGLALLVTIPKMGKERIVMSVLYGVSLVLTYARSVWLSLAASILLTTKNKGIVVLGIIIFAIGIALIPRRFGEGTNVVRTYSVISRYDTDMKYISSLEFDLVTGRGLNIFARKEASANGVPDHPTGPNNSYLFILATMGISGLAGWLLFFRDLYRDTRFKQALTFVLIAALFNNVLFYPYVMLWIIMTETVMVPSEA